MLNYAPLFNSSGMTTKLGNKTLGTGDYANGEMSISFKVTINCILFTEAKLHWEILRVEKLSGACVCVPCVFAHATWEKEHIHYKYIYMCNHVESSNLFISLCRTAFVCCSVSPLQCC